MNRLSALIFNFIDDEGAVDKLSLFFSFLARFTGFSAEHLLPLTQYLSGIGLDSVALF